MKYYTTSTAPVFSLRDLKNAYTNPNVLTIDVKSIDTILNHSAVLSTDSTKSNFLMEKGIEYGDVYDCDFIILTDGKQAFFMKDTSNCFSGRIWSGRNAKIQYLLKCSIIKDFLEL